MEATSMPNTSRPASDSPVPVSKSARKKQRKKAAKQVDEAASRCVSEATEASGGKQSSDESAIVTESSDPEAAQVKWKELILNHMISII